MPLTHASHAPDAHHRAWLCPACPSRPRHGLAWRAGNSLVSLPRSLSGLVSLEGLWLHGNQLSALPGDLGELPALRVLSLSGVRRGGGAAVQPHRARH